jgi:branched-chain amino acid transport system substrate-binding protein
VATLTNPEGFTGATGLFRLRPDGLAEHGLAILEVGQGTARMIEPPPTSFVDRTLGF